MSFLMFLISASVFAASTSREAPQDEAVRIDPKVEKCIRQMTEYLRSLQSYQVEIEDNYEYPNPSGSQYSNRYSIFVQRPNKASFVWENGLTKNATAAQKDISKGGCITDGKQIMQYGYSYWSKQQDTHNWYVLLDAPQTLFSLSWAFRQNVHPCTPIITSLATPNPHESIYDYVMQGIQSAEYIAKDTIDNRRYHHVKCASEEIDWEIWVDDSQKPIIKKMTIDRTRLWNQRQKNGVNQSDPRYTLINFSKWDTNTAFAVNTFDIKPPEGAEDRTGNAKGHFSIIFQDEEQHPLLGNKAPNFELELLDGGKINLAEKLGKKIVILDFWATICIPCIQRLPGVIEIAGKFKDRDIELYAINIKEQREEVIKCMKVNSLNCSVALDLKGKVSDLYHVKPIPALFVIDKQGVVQAIHIRCLNNVDKKWLEDELNAIVSGHSLVSKK